MVNVPLAKDKVGLRFVGFQVGGRGLHGQRARPEPRHRRQRFAPLHNPKCCQGHQQGRALSGGRAALRWAASDRVDLDFPACSRTPSHKGFGDVDVERRRLAAGPLRERDAEGRLVADRSDPGRRRRIRRCGRGGLLLRTRLQVRSPTTPPTSSTSASSPRTRAISSTISASATTAAIIAVRRRPARHRLRPRRVTAPPSKRV